MILCLIGRQACLPAKASSQAQDDGGLRFRIKSGMTSKSKRTPSGGERSRKCGGYKEQVDFLLSLLFLFKRSLKKQTLNNYGRSNKTRIHHRAVKSYSCEPNCLRSITNRLIGEKGARGRHGVGLPYKGMNYYEVDTIKGLRQARRRSGALNN